MVAKRIGLHLFCVLCFTFMAVPSMARYIVVGNLTYTVTDEDQHTVSLNKWNNPKGDVVIPAKVMNEDVEYSVTSIEASVFYNCFSLESVEIPNSVTSI